MVYNNPTTAPIMRINMNTDLMTYGAQKYQAAAPVKIAMPIAIQVIAVNPRYFLGFIKKDF